MATRRDVLRALAALPLARFARSEGRDGTGAPAGTGDPGEIGDDGGRRGRGVACALGEEADAALAPAPRRSGEHLALALSGTPRPAAAEFARRFGSEHCDWIEISLEDRGSVDDGPLAERLRTAASVSLVEAQVLDWLFALYPARRRSAVLHAIFECAATGGRVIGRGSTAFLVAGGGVVQGATRDAPGESRLRQANPREEGVARMAQGLGLCGEMLVDTEARARGSALRLVSTMIESHADLGVLLGARSVLAADLETRSWTALGEDPLLAFDLRGSRRGARALEHARLSVLAAGDGWRRLDRRYFSTGADADFAPAAAEETVADALLFARLAAAPCERRAFGDARTRVELARTVASRAFKSRGRGPVRAHSLGFAAFLARDRWGELED